MAKKTTIVICMAIILICLTSCGIKKSIGNQNNTSSITITTKATKIYNTFKERLPNFEFKNKMNSSYKEGFNYTFSGQCSKKEYEKYLKAVKDSGFTLDAAETKTYYAAKSSDNYYIEITYISAGISVYVTKV